MCFKDHPVMYSVIQIFVFLMIGKVSVSVSRVVGFLSCWLVWLPSLIVLSISRWREIGLVGPEIISWHTVTSISLYSWHFSHTLLFNWNSLRIWRYASSFTMSELLFWEYVITIIWICDSLAYVISRFSRRSRGATRTQSTLWGREHKGHSLWWKLII